MVVPNLTRDHTVVGTPDYMAPEQERNSKKVDPRSDLYSLGCTMYFLLTGNVPFPRLGPIEKIIAHQTHEPPPIQLLPPQCVAGSGSVDSAIDDEEPGRSDSNRRGIGEVVGTAGALRRRRRAVEITVRDSKPHDVATLTRSASSMLPPPSSSSMPGPLAHVRLEEETPPKSQLVTPSDQTPRPEVPNTDEQPHGSTHKPGGAEAKVEVEIEAETEVVEDTP